jgi:carboxyl-terminal processing protease
MTPDPAPTPVAGRPPLPGRDPAAAPPSLEPQPAASGPPGPHPEGRPPAGASPGEALAGVATPSRAARLRRAAGLAALPLLAVALFIGGVAADRAGHVPGAPAAATNPELALIGEAWQTLHRQYVDASHLDDRQLAYGAIEGMTQAVGDPGHTTFLTPDELARTEEALSGNLVGIGIEIDTSDGTVVVRDLIPGSPAAASSLRPGDRVVAVDGTPAKGRPIDAVISEIRGPAGSVVTLTVERAGQTQPLDIRIVREEFEVPVVEWAMVPGTRLALIRLDRFSTGATDALKGALASAKDAGATGIVLDLRGNPGGYVSEAVGVASQFLSSGAVYISRDASGTETPSMVQPGGIATGMPLVVIADGATASAAEIVTGALQDAGRAKVVGETTFGTGTVLSRFDLSDGSALRVGTVLWLTRDGRPIWHQGLAPDIRVLLATDAPHLRPAEVGRLTPARLADSGDAQLLRAIEVLEAS